MRIKNILIVITFFFLFIIDTNALTKETPHININDNYNLTINDKLSITDLKLEYDEYDAIRLNGNFENEFDYNIKYEIDVNVYDKDYNLIYQNKTNDILSNIDKTFNAYKFEKIKDSKVTNIKYFKLKVIIADEELENGGLPSEKYPYQDYVIDKYDIKIKVNKNNTYEITETIDAYFNEEKHGITRIIPFKNKVRNIYGDFYENKARLTGLKINDNYTKNIEEDNYIIQIGTIDNVIKGKKRYVIKYKYDIGEDVSKSYDEFYYNIIGNDWDTFIGNVTFSITMPKEFDKEKLGFYYGEEGSVANDNIVYQINGNGIEGYYKGILDSYEGITVRLELKEGYFQKNLTKYSLYLVPFIFLMLTLLICYSIKKKSQVAAPIQFYPPDNLNSLEIDLYYNGKASEKGITSLLIYLANKGYLKINELDKKDYKEKGKFELIKLENNKPNNEYEREFLDGIFTYSNKVSEKYKTNDGTIHYNKSFYDTSRMVLNDINKEENIKKFLNNHKKLSIIFNIFAVLSVLAINIGSFYYARFENLENPNSIALEIFAIIISLFYVYSLKDNIKRNLIYFSIICLPCILIPFSIITASIFRIICYIVGIIIAVIILIINKNLKVRNAYGNEMLEKINGFKEFLETAEKEKLEMLVNENPTYFYDILPYTYVLDVSDKWIKKFETINNVPPDWYNNNSNYDFNHFETFLFETTTRIEELSSSDYNKSNADSRSKSSYDNHSSGDSSRESSGGGFTGGGSGGGGGRSW